MNKQSIIMFLSFVVITNSMVAQNIHHDKIDEVLFGLNSDAFVSVEVGYSRNLFDDENGKLNFYGFASLPFLLNLKKGTLNDGELNIGTNYYWYASEKFGLITDLNFFVIFHKQILGKFMPLGFNFKLTPSYRFDSGYIGVQFLLSRTLTTYVKHSDYVRSSFTGIMPENLNNPGNNLSPKDGWYGGTGLSFRIGIEGVYRLFDDVNFYYDCGFIDYAASLAGTFDAMMIGVIPFYMHLRFYYQL